MSLAVFIRSSPIGMHGNEQSVGDQQQLLGGKDRPQELATLFPYTCFACHHLIELILASKQEDKAALTTQSYEGHAALQKQSPRNPSGTGRLEWS